MGHSFRKLIAFLRVSTFVTYRHPRRWINPKGGERIASERVLRLDAPLRARVSIGGLALALTALVVLLLTFGGRAAAHVGETFVLDQSHLTTDSNATTASFGQSFTAGTTGHLARINVGMVSGPGSGTLNIYNGGIGSGSPGPISGILLHSQPVTWPLSGLVPFDLTSHVAVIAGNQYTWEITSGVQIGGSFDTIAGGSYPGGRSLVFSFYDHQFQTFVLVPAG